MLKKLIFIAILTVIILMPKLQAQNNDWKINGQIMIRSEVDGRDFSNQTHALTFASMRSRLMVKKNFGTDLGLFFQIQDSRVFGQEPSTMSNINNLDIHQAYATLDKPLGIPVSIKAGRFELSYGTQRFLGAVGWNYIARSWDGAVFTFDPGVKIDIFALTQRELQGYIGNAKPSIFGDNAANSPSFSVYGFWANKEINKSNELNLFGYYENNRIKSDGINSDLERITAGVNHFGTYGKLKTIFEAAYQLGNISDLDVSAYTASLKLIYSLKTFSFGVGGDIVSGTSPNPDPNDTLSRAKYNTFNPSYGTNHKFYGYMDYFINLPGNTNNLGLNDYYIMLKWKPADSKINLGANFHIFMTNQKDLDNNNALGKEIDLTVNYNFIKGTKITWGGSIFLQDEVMKSFFDSPSKFTKTDPAFWTYLMITSNL